MRLKDQEQHLERKNDNAQLPGSLNIRLLADIVAAGDQDRNQQQYKGSAGDDKTTAFLREDSSEGPCGPVSVQSPISVKKTGLPRQEAASTRKGYVVPGQVPVHAARLSEAASEFQDGSDDWNCAGSKPASLNSCIPIESGGGSRRSSRPAAE